VMWRDLSPGERMKLLSNLSVQPKPVAAEHSAQSPKAQQNTAESKDSAASDVDEADLTHFQHMVRPLDMTMKVVISKSILQPFVMPVDSKSVAPADAKDGSAVASPTAKSASSETIATEDGKAVKKPRYT